MLGSRSCWDAGVLAPPHACLLGSLSTLCWRWQGKKEKKRREKKKEKEVIPIGAPAEEEPRQLTVFEELEREVSSKSCPDSTNLQYLRLAWQEQ